jgi:hypothetical protein
LGIAHWHSAYGRLNSGAAPKAAIVELKNLNIAFQRPEAFRIILMTPVVAIRPTKEECSERGIFTHEEGPAVDRQVTRQNASRRGLVPASLDFHGTEFT